MSAHRTTEIRTAILTVSDRGYRGERSDASGPRILSWLNSQPVRIVQTAIVPDEIPAISGQIKAWADGKDCDLVLTTGGTGVSPRDVTPEATSKILDRVLPGYGELMRLKSLEKTPMAIISRAVAGIRGECLIINLPGSPQAAIENLQAVWPAVAHTVEKIQGDNRDCAERFA